MLNKRLRAYNTPNHTFSESFVALGSRTTIRVRSIRQPTTPTKDDRIYKKPFVTLTRLSCLCVASDDSCSAPCATEASLILRLLMLPTSLPNPPATPRPPRALFRSNLRPFQPSSSLSNLSPLSRSSLSSRSARLADNWFAESEVWSSSMVDKRLEILSRALAKSSVRDVTCLSRRSICDCKSLTVRSTVRMLRASVDRLDSAASRDFSSCTPIRSRSRTPIGKLDQNTYLLNAPM
jgi:hypothetical protein